MPAPRTSLLAFDPGTKYLGYAAFEGRHLIDFGVRTIRQGSPSFILEHVGEIVERMLVEKRPLLVACERNQFSQQTGNYRLLYVIEQIEGRTRAHRIRTVGYGARTIRRVVTGNGNARKRDAAKIVAARYPETRPLLKGRTGTQERYFGNMFDAVACGMAAIASGATGPARLGLTAGRKGSRR